MSKPVGIAGKMPGTDGFTMAVFRAADVPVGTELFAAAAPTVSEPVAGLTGGLSDETRAALAEIDEAQRAAAVQASSIIVGSAPTVSEPVANARHKCATSGRCSDLDGCICSDDELAHPSPTRAAALAEEVERLKTALRKISQGNLGDDPWQANYAAIKEVARAALAKTER